MALPSLYPLLLGYVVLVTLIALAIMAEDMWFWLQERQLGKQLVSFAEATDQPSDYELLGDVPFPVEWYVAADARSRRYLEQGLRKVRALVVRPSEPGSTRPSETRPS
jgi:hypothetical protein